MTGFSLSVFLPGRKRRRPKNSEQVALVRRCRDVPPN